MSFKLSNRRCEEIKKIIVDIFDKFNIKSLPINGFKIATKLGVKVIPYSSKPKNIQNKMMNISNDGFSIKYKGKWYIFYNDKMNYGRINYTIAHECGHIVLNHTEESELAEAEANFFAKYSLAPPVLIHKLNLKSVKDIIEHFDLSYEASTYAFEYYSKRLNCGYKDFTDYELKMIELFGFTNAETINNINLIENKKA